MPKLVCIQSAAQMLRLLQLYFVYLKYGMLSLSCKGKTTSVAGFLNIADHYLAIC